MIEDLGHVFAGSLGSFVDLQNESANIVMDCALVDIDLADGRSGINAVTWLSDRKIPCLFVTGQVELAARYSDCVFGVIDKPVTEAALAAGLQKIESELDTRKNLRPSMKVLGPP